MMKDHDALMSALDLLWTNFRNCRAYFPFMSEKAIGQTGLQTAPLYQSLGFDIRFEFSRPITAGVRDKNNEIADWLNENFIIRLLATLESFHVVSKVISIVFTLDGANEVNIVRRLRHCFAHSSGRYDPANEYHVTTVKMMRDYLHIATEGTTTWDTSIDTVLKPLFECCKRYAIAKLRIPTE